MPSELSQRLILASSSPRRKEILAMAGFEFEIIPSTYQEPLHSDRLCDPREFARELALGKGKEVFERTGKTRWVLSADTVGIIGHEVLEKPLDRADAKRMLQALSGKEHIVLTVVALFSPDHDDPLVEEVTTKVLFSELEEKEIERYLDHDEYQDKAAAYAIQGRASVFVEKIEGDYFNVVGLPISTVSKMLKSMKRHEKND